MIVRLAHNAELRGGDCLSGWTFRPVGGPHRVGFKSLSDAIGAAIEAGLLEASQAPPMERFEAACDRAAAELAAMDRGTGFDLYRAFTVRPAAGGGWALRALRPHKPTPIVIRGDFRGDFLTLAAVLHRATWYDAGILQEPMEPAQIVPLLEGILAELVAAAKPAESSPVKRTGVSGDGDGPEASEGGRRRPASRGGGFNPIGL